MSEISVLGRGKAGRALALALGVPNLSHEASPDGLVILAVPDRAIQSVGVRFKGRSAHLSGSVHIDDVPAAHPLTSFDGQPAEWTGTPLGLTGPVPKPIVRALEGLGFVSFELPADKKALYHAAAVLTSGHAATLWLAAAGLLKEQGIDLPGDGLFPLAQKTLENVRNHGLAGRTGPFVRGDQATIDRDAAALPEPWRTLFLQLGNAPLGRT